MAFAIFEYANTTPNGEPIEPPTNVVEAQAFGTAYQVTAGTEYVAVCPDADMRIRIEDSSSVEAEATDRKVLAGETRGFPIRDGARPYIDGIAA